MINFEVLKPFLQITFLYTWYRLDLNCKVRSSLSYTGCSALADQIMPEKAFRGLCKGSPNTRYNCIFFNVTVMFPSKLKIVLSWCCLVTLGCLDLAKSGYFGKWVPTIYMSITGSLLSTCLPDSNISHCLAQYSLVAFYILSLAYQIYISQTCDPINTLSIFTLCLLLLSPKVSKSCKVNSKSLVLILDCMTG